MPLHLEISDIWMRSNAKWRERCLGEVVVSSCLFWLISVIDLHTESMSSSNLTSVLEQCKTAVNDALKLSAANRKHVSYSYFHRAAWDRFYLSCFPKFSLQCKRLFNLPILNFMVDCRMHTRSTCTAASDHSRFYLLKSMVRKSAL